MWSNKTSRQLEVEAEEWKFGFDERAKGGRDGSVLTVFIFYLGFF